jgi:putative hemolysin
MISVDALLSQYFPAQSHHHWFKPLLRRVLYEHDLQQFAEQYPHLHGLDFIEQVLGYFDFACEVADHELEHIPSSGPVVLVANHPIGTLDGMALLRVVAKVRPDVRIMANQMLAHVAPMRPLLFPVDNMGSRTNRQQIEAMREHLAEGRALIVFPAGEVSRLRPQGVRDGRWNPGFLRLAARSRAPIVPLYVRGRNSPLFYLTSMLYKPLATLLLVREMFAHRRGRIHLRIGARIPYAAWADKDLTLEQLAKRFRKHLYRLAKGKSGLFKSESPIALPEERALLKREVEHCEHLGQTPDGKQIYLYRRQDQPHAPILRELGRLREIAFRAVGEGTGQRRDLDKYDDDYLHLLLWDPGVLEIVGAYRFIPTAEQLARKGLAGLYSHSLFAYGEQMDDVLQQGLELGRSFIQPAYWGRRGLDYLWQGIGAFLARNPQYRYLFGPVSISGSLPMAARDLLIAFYRLYFPAKLGVAHSRRPYPASLPQVLEQFSGQDYAADLARLKSMLDNLGCAIPTLYKQYSELCETGGVQFMDFGTDPDFADCVDGLVLVDLSRLKAAKYQRYIAIHQSLEKEVAA